METPKSKLFGFKKSGRNSERSSPSDGRSISKTEVIDLETLPISESAIPTSPAISRINTAFQGNGQSSPQFVVGWNDGAGSNDLDMCSPIRAVPVLRNIRRCPDSYTFQAPKKKSRDSKEDILQCIDWSKNLFETTSREKGILPDEEKPISPVADENILLDQEIKANDVTESRSETKAINIDILDDSADEMMILCSQAVEQSLPLSRHPPVSPISRDIPRKHPITPDGPCRKRLRTDAASNTQSQCIKENPKAGSTSVNVKTCNHAPFKIPSNSKQEIKATNPVESSKVGSKVPNSSELNQDLFEALLNDDEDDLFGSFDFHSIDKKLQHTQNKGVPLKSVSAHASFGGPKVDTSRNPKTKPVPKYTKEQIEQRRLEAKKRLLFNRKHKSV